MKKPHDRLIPDTRLLLQRIAVAAFVALAGLHAVSYRSPPDDWRGDYIATPQLQPAERIRSAQLERALERVSLSDDTRLIIDASLESALAQSLAEIPPDRRLPFEAMNRYRLLIEKTLPHPAGSEFFELFARYAAYRSAAGELLFPRESETLEQETARWAKLRALRREHFPAEADALFGREEALAEHMLTVRRIEADDTLTDTQKAAALEQAQSALDSRMAQFP
jgi:hypothetical protein